MFLSGQNQPFGMALVAGTFYVGNTDGMVIGQHGSWNRSTLSGYRLIFIPFREGRPAGAPRDILTGFLSPDEKLAHGRPVGVAVGPDRRSLLMADDVGDVVWRVAGACPGPIPVPRGGADRLPLSKTRTMR